MRTQDYRPAISLWAQTTQRTLSYQALMPAHPPTHTGLAPASIQGYESYIDPKSLITDGTIDITINEDGTYTIVFNCIDDNPTEPHTISGSWTGELGSL